MQEKVTLKIGDILESYYYCGGMNHTITPVRQDRINVADVCSGSYPLLDEKYYVNGKLYAVENIIVPEFKEEEKIKSNEITPIPEYEGLYGATRDGKIWSYPKRWVAGRSHAEQFHLGKYLQPAVDDAGYNRVCLRKNGTPKVVHLHRLVAAAYIPNPNNKPCINHIDGNPNNNHISNLEWCTHAENMQHAYNTGLNIPRSGAAHPLYNKGHTQQTKDKISRANKGKIRTTPSSNCKETICIELNLSFSSAKEAAEFLNCHRLSVAHAIRNNTKCGGYTWIYRSES